MCATAVALASVPPTIGSWQRQQCDSHLSPHQCCLVHSGRFSATRNTEISIFCVCVCVYDGCPCSVHFNFIFFFFVRFLFIAGSRRFERRPTVIICKIIFLFSLDFFKFMTSFGNYIYSLFGKVVKKMNAQLIRKRAPLH